MVWAWLSLWARIALVAVLRRLLGRKVLLGDRIARVTSAMGVKPCNGCTGRKVSINGWHARLFGGIPPEVPKGTMRPIVVRRRDGSIQRFRERQQ